MGVQTKFAGSRDGQVGNRDAAHAALAADGWTKDGYYWVKGADRAIVDEDQPSTVFIAHTTDGKWEWEA
jgi:hypothetical protein